MWWYFTEQRYLPYLSILSCGTLRLHLIIVVQVVKGLYWGMPVAVKVMSSNLELLLGDTEQAYKEEVLRFVDEGKMLSSLHHVNIVRCFGTSYDDAGRLLLVMEYCERGSLFDLLKSNHEFGWPELWQFAFHCSTVRRLVHASVQ